MKALLFLALLIPTAVVIPIASTLWRGYVLSKVWLWLMVPIFGVSALTVAQSIAVTTVASFLTHQFSTYKDKTKKPWERLVQVMAYAFLGPALTLLMAHILRSWI